MNFKRDFGWYQESICPLRVNTRYLLVEELYNSRSTMHLSMSTASLHMVFSVTNSNCLAQY